MIIIGITGGLGTGKSTAAGMFRKLGAKVFDADRIAHETLKKGTSTYRKVVKEFGKCILSKEGRINRAKLAEIVFKDMAKVSIFPKLSFIDWLNKPRLSKPSLVIFKREANLL